MSDTDGDSATLLYNMSQPQIDPGDFDAVVLSHTHNYHVCGLSCFLQEKSAITVYLPKSFRKSFEDNVQQFGAKVGKIDEAMELATNVYATGELGNDVMEQSLVVTTSEGLMIITGCAHLGMAKIVEIANEILPDK